MFNKIVMFRYFPSTLLAILALIIVLPGCAPTAGQAALDPNLKKSGDCVSQKRTLDKLHDRGQSNSEHYKKLIDQYMNQCL